MTTLNTIIKEEKKEFWSKFAGKNTSLIPMNINTWLTTAMQRAYEAGKADSAHENTPDIEWEKELEQHAPNLTFKSLDNGVNTISMVWLKSFIRTTLTSRDTYWREREALTSEREYLRGFREAQYLEKERVRKEVEGMRGEVREHYDDCDVQTGKSQRGECRCSLWRNHHRSVNQALDTLLDNLK